MYDVGQGIFVQLKFQTQTSDTSDGIDWWKYNAYCGTDQCISMCGKWHTILHKNDQAHFWHRLNQSPKAHILTI